LKRAQVRAQAQTESSPLEVIAHARWAAQRGRQPSMQYRGERNPRRALALALSDIGATMADLHTVELHEQPQAVATLQPWLRKARGWLHHLRTMLRKKAVHDNLPAAFTDRMIEAALPSLVRLASDLGISVPAILRDRTRTRRYDNRARNTVYSRNELNIGHFRPLAAA